MATRIRLKRIGRRNRPFYRVVVMDSRQRRDGAAVEELGWYNPIAKDKENNYKLNEERILHWLQTGAQPSEIAHKLIKRAGIAFKWHLMKQGLDEKAIEKEIQKLDLRREEQAKAKLEAEEKQSKKKAKEVKQEATAPVDEEKTEESERPVEEKVEKEVKAEEVKQDETSNEEKTEESKTEEEVIEPAEEKADDSIKAEQKEVTQEQVEEVTTDKGAQEDKPKEESAAKTESKDEVKDDK